MSSSDLVREVKYRAQIDRDTELANRLNVGRANVSAWLKDRSNPDGLAMLKLCELANLSATEARVILEREPLRQAGFADISLLAGMGAMSLSAVHYPIESLIAGGIAAGVYTALYIMRSNKIINKPSIISA